MRTCLEKALNVPVSVAILDKVCVCVCVCLCVCVRACVRERACVSVRARVCGVLFVLALVLDVSM